jgi:hypothetical protein
MAATTQAGDKSRKQLYIVAGLGAVLAVLVVIQAPKLLGGGGSEATPPTTTESVPTSQGTTDGSGATSGSGAGARESAVLAGVTFKPGVVSKPGEGQLASFSLFDSHDPFVQVVKESGSGGSQDGEPTGVKVSGGKAGAGASGTPGAVATPGPTGSTGATGAVAGASQLTSATISVNGSDESVDVKKRFPKVDPTFVLVSLKAKVAQIGVVGGAFANGATIPLKMGKSLTLVNTATGARYTLKLLYTGSEPEQVQGFTQAQD